MEIYKDDIRTVNYLGNNEYKVVAGGRVFTLNASPLSPSKLIPADVAMVREAGQNPADYCSYGRGVMPWAVARAIHEHSEMLHEQRKAEIAARIPGLDELRQAHNAWEAFDAEFARRMDDEALSSFLPDKPEVTVKEVAARYPVAALYLRADAYKEAANDRKYSAGCKAAKLLEERGEAAMDEARQILDDWTGGKFFD